MDTEDLTRLQKKTYVYEIIEAGFFYMAWGTPGCKNLNLLKDFKKPENKWKYHFFYTSQMDFNEIWKKSQKTFKFPLYIIADKIDQHLEAIIKKKSGFSGFLPSKQH